MSELYQSLSHSKWDCKYHVVYHVVFVYKTPAEDHLRPAPSEIGDDLPLVSAAEGMPDSRRTSDARPCTHVHRDSPQAPGSFGDWVSQREECHCDCPAMRQGTEFLGRTFLGPRLCRLHCRLRTGAGPSIHPRAGCRGWNSRTILNQPIRRATRDA